MKNKESAETIAIKVDKEVKKEFKDFANQRGLSLTGLIRLAVYEYMKASK